MHTVKENGIIIYFLKGVVKKFFCILSTYVDILKRWCFS